MTKITENDFLTPDPLASPTRRSRAVDNRNYDTRKAKERSPIAYSSLFGAGSIFNVPKDILDNDPDHEYVYAPYSCRNQQLEDELHKVEDRHFVPVEATMHSALGRTYSKGIFKERPDADKYIRKGGQIMMRRKKEICEVEREFYDSNNFEKRKMIEMFKQGDARAPYISQYQRSYAPMSRF